MRKFFTLIACTAIALPFAACSSDNDDNNKNNGGEDPIPGSTNIIKSITATTNDNGKTETQIITFEYDTDDRLTKMSSNKDDAYYTFGYEGNIVTATEHDTDTDEETGKTYTYDYEYEGRLLNGRVDNGSRVNKRDNSKRIYTVNYDGNGYLRYLAKVRISDGSKDTINVTWNNGNITQTYSDDKFMATPILNNANIDLNAMVTYCYGDLEELYPFAIIRKTGTACKNIILDAEFEGNPVSQNYTYKTSTNGYLTEINYVSIDDQKMTLVITYK